MIQLSIYGETPEEEIREFRELFNSAAVPRSVFDDIAQLQTDVSELKEATADSGWHTLTLINGAEAYNEAQKPMYRKIGKTVFLAGVFKGIEGSNIQIAKLPEGFRPSKKVILPFASIGTKINRMEILEDGIIQYSRSTTEPTVAANWHSIACSFSTD